MTTNLLQKTRNLLENRDKTQARYFGDIVKKVPELTVDWLYSFSQGRITDPGVRKVQALHDYLNTIQEPPGAIDGEALG